MDTYNKASENYNTMTDLVSIFTPFIAEAVNALVD